MPNAARESRPALGSSFLIGVIALVLVAVRAGRTRMVGKLGWAAGRERAVGLGGGAAAHLADPRSGPADHDAG